MDIIKRKPIAWIGDSREAIRGFPDVAKQRTGRELARVQEGLEPTDYKPMPSIGLGVSELRVREDTPERMAEVARALVFERKADRRRLAG